VLIRTRIYRALNSLFGRPTRVMSESAYSRTGSIFKASTTPILSSIEHYLRGAQNVLIVGCGNGEEACWFADRVPGVAAVDVSEEAVERSRHATAAYSNVRCELIDGVRLPFDDASFNLIFMHNVCEHVIHLDESFTEYRRVLRDGGLLVNDFGPMFYSPFGAHLQDALKLPWGHLVFGLRSVVELRNEYYPGHCSAESWEEIGLNRLTESEYRKLVQRCGFRLEAHEVRVSKNVPLVRHIPIVRNLFVFGIHSVLRKPCL